MEKEKEVLTNALEFVIDKICAVLKRTIRFGVAYHNSGLTVEERKLLKYAFKSGFIYFVYFNLFLFQFLFILDDSAFSTSCISIFKPKQI